MKIEFLKNSDIDRKKWDNCISVSKKKSIYGYSWFLDIIAEKWNAIIMDDYKAVLPLPYNKKFLINYIYTPTHLQKVAIYSEFETNEKLHEKFISKIPNKYALVDLRIDFDNFSQNKSQIYLMKNYILNLNNDYINIFNKFRRNTKRNINKANSKVFIKKSDDYTDFIVTRKNIILKRLKDKVTEYDYVKYKKLLEFLKQNNYLVVYNAYDENDEFCASACFFLIDKTATISHITKEEKAGLNPNYAIIDKFIQDFCGQELILDFAGSNVEGIEYFNSGFGSELVYYSRFFKYNWQFMKYLRKNNG